VHDDLLQRHLLHGRSGLQCGSAEQLLHADQDDV
jgi:hypothetical protein